MKFIVAAIALVGVLSIPGCDNATTKVHGVTQGSTHWGSRSDDAMPGIDEASISFNTLKAGPPQGVTFVVWSDLSEGVSGHGGGSGTDIHHEGTHRGSDGKQIKYRCGINADGTTGTITIAKTTYDSSKGTFILVSTKHDPPVVRQLDIDTANVPNTKEGLQEFAKSKDRIGDFSGTKRVLTNFLNTSTE